MILDALMSKAVIVGFGLAALATIGWGIDHTRLALAQKDVVILEERNRSLKSQVEAGVLAIKEQNERLEGIIAQGNILAGRVEQAEEANHRLERVYNARIQEILSRPAPKDPGPALDWLQDGFTRAAADWEKR